MRISSQLGRFLPSKTMKPLTIVYILAYFVISSDAHFDLVRLLDSESLDKVLSTIYHKHEEQLVNSKSYKYCQIVFKYRGLVTGSQMKFCQNWLKTCQNEVDERKKALKNIVHKYKKIFQNRYVDLNFSLRP